jgi:hypothetical protein
VDAQDDDDEEKENEEEDEIVVSVRNRHKRRKKELTMPKSSAGRMKKSKSTNHSGAATRPDDLREIPAPDTVEMTSLMTLFVRSATKQGCTAQTASGYASTARRFITSQMSPDDTLTAGALRQLCGRLPREQRAIKNAVSRFLDICFLPSS